jgi:predicted nucleotidyltransferase component of viral defense system
MFDINRHKIFLVKILKEIYSDPTLRNILGFKGGTAAYLFYELPRFSVDLDFDLLEGKKKDFVFTRLKEILPKVETLIESTKKRYTLFYLMSYEKGEIKIKIEISKRQCKNSFIVKSYLGIPILLMAKRDMAASKLAALLTRKKFAARDLFDLWFFLKNNWEIDEETVKEKTGLTLKTAILKAIERIKKIKKNQLLQGLGGLLDEKQKPWVKENLQREALFYLKYFLEEL